VEEEKVNIFVASGGSDKQQPEEEKK